METLGYIALGINVLALWYNKELTDWIIDDK